MLYIFFSAALYRCRFFFIIKYLQLHTVKIEENVTCHGVLRVTLHLSGSQVVATLYFNGMHAMHYI